jgi:serine/threonine protein kinase
LSDSTDYNYPTSDEPTREFTSSDDGSDSLQFSSTSAISGGEVPEQIGDYAIRELIGAGGMGQVFLAEHTRMQRIVAIKMLPVERMADAAAIGRFYDEVRAASRLMHPNIVTAFDAGESEGVHYLAMEYIDGLTLTDVVAKQGPLSVGEAAGVIRQAALGLLHAHRAGIVHRDVKPGNLMRASDGTVKVLDLGLARISTANLASEVDKESNDADEKRSKGRLTGTLPFISPEQLEDSSVADPRSDIYSLGATMYFLLTGRPPYTGEFLDQIYGHRHGEIPDLMQARADVDMQFANIFTRMMAKSPDERYGSLDEVIDDLSEYANKSDSPVWLTEFAQQQTGADQSTITSVSTSRAPASVLSIDFGMFYSAAAEASPSGDVKLLCAGNGNRTIFRMAVASDDERVILGGDAMERRAEHAHNVVHCLPIYIGKKEVEREIAGRQCPPEVLMAMMFRRIRENAWPADTAPYATAITIPGSFDQLHRRSVLQAAEMAGLRSVRLLHRSIACVQSLSIDPTIESLDEDLMSLDPAQDQRILFVGVTGQATEVSVMRRDSSRIHQLSTAGHWHTGTLPWLHRLVDLATKEFVRKHKFNPRKRARSAVSLQMACERAMNSMLLMPSALIKIDGPSGQISVKIERRRWLQACEDLAAGVRATIKTACREASISLRNIDICVTLGPLLRIPTIRDAVLRGHSEKLEISPLDRADTARGAAACLAAELPGRREISMPPRSVTSQSIGLVVNDAKGRRRILPIIPKGTALPARTNRRLTVGAERESMTLSLVESSGVEGDDWHSLGRHDFEVGDSKTRTRMIGFELNVNGVLTVRAQAPGTSGSTKLATLPTPALSDEDLIEWTKWIDNHR